MDLGISGVSSEESESEDELIGLTVTNDEDPSASKVTMPTS